MRAPRFPRVTILALLAVLSSACTKPPPRGAEGGDLGPLPEAPKHLVLERAQTAGSAEPAPLLRVLREELARNLRGLATDDLPPYFMAYGVTEEHAVTIEASSGALLGSERSAFRNLDAEVRLGSTKLDNTHRLRGEWNASRDFTQAAWLPLDDDEAAVRAVAWLTTHAEHQRAREALGRVRANQQVLVQEEDGSDDFAPEPAVSYHEPVSKLVVDERAWEARTRRWSSAFRKHPEIEEGRVGMSASSETRYFASTEGSSVQISAIRAKVEIVASTTASDGMQLVRMETVDAPSPEALTNDDQMIGLVNRVAEDLLALRRAPLIEPFAGPAILDGRAAAVFFHEIFGHRVEGHRQKDEEEGQTFAHKVGEAVMPAFLDVFDDPGVTTLNGVPLSGHYLFDDEGVPGRKATLVDGGVLRGFLLSRSPLRGFARSNGHGRRQHGHRVVSRQANLIVDPGRTTTPAALKERLLQEIRRQRKPFGLRFHEITGGYTNTTRYGSQAFKVLPVMVYRVYPDGREELVRGVDLEGTPLSALARIEAAANDFEVFNGVCGAESGWVPVSATSPSILVSQIEVTRQEKSHDRPPLLPPPKTIRAKRTP